MNGMRASLLHGWLLLRSLTLRRAWNAVAVLLSYAFSKITHIPLHLGMPVAIGIEPTTACNLRCPQCPSGLRSFTRPTGRLQTGLYSSLLNELHPTLWQLILYFQGEPYLNPHFTSLVKQASSKGLFTYSSTNAHFLDDATAKETVMSGLSYLVVSMDGVTQETYSRYRIEGELAKVLAGIENLVRWKRALKSITPFIEMQFIVFKHNEHEVDAAKLLGKQIGVNRVNIKSAQVYDEAGAESLIPTQGVYSRYVKRNGKHTLKNKLLNHCWKLWQGAEITWDGRVLPCCFDKDAQHEMGRVGEKTFTEIWRGSSYTQFRQNLTRARAEIDICQNCTEGTRVQLV